MATKIKFKHNMTTEINNNHALTDNISSDTSDVKDIPKDIPNLIEPNPQPAQKTEFEFIDLVQRGKEVFGSDGEYKLEFDTQIVDGGKVIARKITGEFLLSARVRFRNCAIVTNDKSMLVVPMYFTDIETDEKLEIHVGNNKKDINKETPEV